MCCFFDQRFQNKVEYKLGGRNSCIYFGQCFTFYISVTRIHLHLLRYTFGAFRSVLIVLIISRGHQGTSGCLVSFLHTCCLTERKGGLLKMAGVPSSSSGFPSCLLMFEVSAFISTTEFIFMTLNTCGLALHHIRLASLLQFSGMGDIMPRSLKSFAGSALRHLSSQNNRNKKNGWSQCLWVSLPLHTLQSFFSKAGVGASLVLQFSLRLDDERAPAVLEVIS